MKSRPTPVLTVSEIQSAKEKAIEIAKAEVDTDTWEALSSLLTSQMNQRESASALLDIVEDHSLSVEHALSVLKEVHVSHSRDLELLCRIGECCGCARDIDNLNIEAPSDPFFNEVVSQLSSRLESERNGPNEKIVLLGLATAARMSARQFDALAYESTRRLVELEPDLSYRHYNLGLLCKTRGRFYEGMRANQTAARLATKPSEAVQWNLGICATGAGEGTVALDIWKGELKNIIEMGRFGLPDGSYPQCKVKLAERPLAERSKDNDDPGLEETIWIERLSPCHGIVRSVLFQRLGVDYGDVVLFDGAPITYHTYGDRRIPVFPHLATLVRRDYQFFDFSGTQEEANELGNLSKELGLDAVIYSHSEQYQVLCANCWRDPEHNHEEHEKIERHVVSGRIAAPPEMSPQTLIAQIDAALLGKESCKLFAPDLSEAAGLYSRASVERRRFDMLRS